MRRLRSGLNADGINRRGLLRAARSSLGSILCIVAAAAWGFAPPAYAADDVSQARDALDRAYAQRLEELAAWCDAQGLAQEAQRTRQWLPQDRQQRLLLFDPTQTPQVNAAQSPDAAAQWWDKFMALRQARAGELFELARAAADGEHVSLALELIGGTLREDPDHEAARRVMGFERYDGAWHTHFTRTRQRAGQVWHEQFGWLPQSQVARYEAGERYHRGRWITAEHDARLHATIDTAWELQTEHFEITTNHSLEAAARFGAQLERLYWTWQQACGAYTTSAAELKALLDGGTRPARAIRRHQVVVFRNQAEYQQALRGEIPEQVTTSGIYIPRRRTAYFFVPEAKDQAAPQFDDTVLYHEAVHQLFNESRTVVPEPGVRHNFWLIEAIACYFESLAPRDGYVTVGGTETQRFRAAQYRLLNDRFYVPLAELCGLGRDDLQRHPSIATLYSQSAGLAQFFMHGDLGRRRDGFLSALQLVYTGRDRADTLATATGESFAVLDQQYRKFITDTARQQP